MSSTLNAVEARLDRMRAAWPGRRTFNARVVSDILGIKYQDLLALIRQGVFPAWKASGCWEVPIEGKGSPVDWYMNRRFDTSRRFKAGLVPYDVLLQELE